MTNLTQKLVVQLHDAKIQRDLRRDEEGLTMLAYALGAAVIIVPLAAAVLTFGQGAVDDAALEVDAASRRQSEQSRAAWRPSGSLCVRALAWTETEPPLEPRGGSSACMVSWRCSGLYWERQPRRRSRRRRDCVESVAIRLSVAVADLFFFQPDASHDRQLRRFVRDVPTPAVVPLTQEHQLRPREARLLPLLHSDPPIPAEAELPHFPIIGR